MGGGVNARAYDDLDTRGGPPIVSPAEWFYNFFIGSDSRQRWQLSMNGGLSGNEEGGWNRPPTSCCASSPAGPAGDAQRRLHLGRRRRAVDHQYRRTGDGADDHVYGRLKRNVVSVTGRATYAFTRDMTLEVYLQPFVAVGDYSDIRRLAQPKSFEFEPATISDPDFNRKSLRGNVVFRWEYLRGSALFVVWNVDNADSPSPASSPCSATPQRLRRHRHPGLHGQAELLAGALAILARRPVECQM